MKTITYILITLVSFNFCNAQSHRVSTDFESSLNLGGDPAFDYERVLLNAVKKSELFNLDWQSAEIKLNDNPQLVKARYNPFIDAMEINKDDKIFELAKRNNQNITFLDTGISYQARSYFATDGKIYTTYFIVDTSAADTTILKREVIETSSQKKALSYLGVNGEQSKLTKVYFYYVIDDSNRLYQLTTNRRDLKKMFPDDAKSIISFIKTHNIRSNNKEDLITLAGFINSPKNETLGM